MSKQPTEINHAIILAVDMVDDKVLGHLRQWQIFKGGKPVGRSYNGYSFAHYMAAEKGLKNFEIREAA